MSWKDMQIVEMVQSAPGITSAELAERMGVCDRTVRTYIKHANDCLEGIAKIGCMSRCGYKLTIQDEQAFEQWLSRAGGHREQLRRLKIAWPSFSMICLIEQAG